MKNNEIAVPDLVLALDPGRDKCGVAIVKRDGTICFHLVVPVAQMQNLLPEIAAKWHFSHIVLGDATSSQEWRAKIEKWLPETTICLQNERDSTLEARPLYWERNPPRGWRRLVPLSLQTPPEPVDDFAAVVLALRFFSGFASRQSDAA